MNDNVDPNYIGDGIYKENIIDHYKNPHNHGTIENADVKITENNPLCGDVVTITLKINSGKISDAKFVGRGCAISQAAASMLTDEIKGKNIEEAKNLKREDVTEMLGIEIGPVRTKCAVLSLVAVKEGINQFENKNISNKSKNI